MCNLHSVKKYGVVLVTRCRPKGSEEAVFLALRERRAKPEFFKLKDMIALPSETGEESDACVCATVKRLGHEELGIVLHSKDIVILREPLTHFRHDHPVYVAWTEVQLEYVPQPNDPDVEYWGWFTRRAFHEMSKYPGFLRIETIDVLEAACESMDGRAPSPV